MIAIPRFGLKFSLMALATGSRACFGNLLHAVPHRPALESADGSLVGGGTMHQQPASDKITYLPHVHSHSCVCLGGL